MAIKGLIELEQSIFCSKEVLGKSIPATIGNQDIRVVFPNLPEIDHSIPEVGIANPLLAPASFSNWKNAEWGYPKSYPTVSATVHALGLLYTSEAMSPTDIQKAYDEIPEWIKKLQEMCIILKPEVRHRDRNLGNADAQIYIYDDSEYIQNEKPVMLYAYLIENNNALSYEDVLLAIEYASRGSELHMEYKMMLSAYEARKQCDNRKVVLDACSAVELCLVKRIEEYCDEKSIEVRMLTDKYRTLGDRFKLVGMIDESFDESGYRNTITELRNSVFHNRNINPNDEETDAVIKKSEECLEYFHKTYF